MKIVVRTKEFPVFLMFFKSFVIFYPEKIKDLIVQVQISHDNYKLFETFKEIKRKEGKRFQTEGYDFQIIYVQDKDFLHNNNWAEMIYQSLQYEQVLSLDDDVIFIGPGLFDVLQNYTEKKIYGFKVHDSEMEIINSAFIFNNGVKINKEDFTDLKSIKKYLGYDTAILHRNHINEIEFIDNKIYTLYNNFSPNTIKNDYFIHLGSINCELNRNHFYWKSLYDSNGY